MRDPTIRGATIANDPAYARARKLIKESRRDEAQDVYLALLPTYPDEPILAIKLSLNASMLGRYDEAVHYARRAVELRPESQTCSYFLYHALFEARKLEEVVDELVCFVANNDSTTHNEFLYALRFVPPQESDLAAPLLALRPYLIQRLETLDVHRFEVLLPQILEAGRRMMERDEPSETPPLDDVQLDWKQ